MRVSFRISFRCKLEIMLTCLYESCMQVMRYPVSERAGNLSRMGGREWKEREGEKDCRLPDIKLSFGKSLPE